MPVTVLLTNTNWWPCSAHVAIAMAGAGCRVAAAYPRRGHPLAHTKAVSKRFSYRAAAPLQSLAKAIEESDADLIVPCDDRAVLHLHRLHSRALENGDHGTRLADLIERSLGSPAAFDIVSSRAALLRTAIGAGIRVPEMEVVSDPRDLRRWNLVQPFPWVVKVDRSWGGHGVKVVRTLHEAEDFFHRMSEPLGTPAMLKRTLVNRDPFWIEPWVKPWVDTLIKGQRSPAKPGITVQSYIEGHPANCVAFCWKGKVLSAIAVSVVAAQGLMGPATVVRIIDNPQMLDAAAALAGRLNLSGFHGFDFMIEDSTGTAFLVELNPRCAMPCHLRLGPGRDLVGSLYAQLSGCSPASPAPLPGSGLVSYFPQAWLSDPRGEALRTGYHDVPWGEPELLKELLRLPWPDRSFLARFTDRLRNLTLEQRSARRYVFEPAPGNESH